MTSRLQYRDDPALRYRLHRLALLGGSAELQPGYRRTEERLRPRLPAGPLSPLEVDAALGEGGVPDDDRAWFARRDEAEQAQRARQLEALAESPFGALPLPGGSAGFVLSTAVRAVPALAPSWGLIAAGPETPPPLLWFAGAALHPYQQIRRHRPALPLDTARLAALMLAGQEVAAVGLPDQPLELLLGDIVKVVLPPQHRRDETASMLEACRAAGLLPEHPGEFERMVHGIPRRRADRIHRAWLRRSFVLPGPEDGA